MSQLASSSTWKSNASDAPPQSEWTCPCLNIRLAVEVGVEQPSGSQDSAWLALLSSDNAITVQYPSLTSRETITLEESGTNAVCARCLNCDTIVYAASKPAPLGPNRALGFNTSNTGSASASREHTQSPSRDPSGAARIERSRSNEPLVRPLDRKIWILPDALSPKKAAEAATAEAYSSSFGVLVKHSLTNVEDNSQHLTTSGFDQRRDTTPTRPTLGGTRQPSFGSAAGGRSYALPPVPQHLITTPPQSPRVGGPATPPVPAAASVPASSSFLGATNTQHPLAAQLDSVAVERLKDLRSKAEAEVFELVRQKRREMEMLEKRMKMEAEALLDLAKHPKPIKNDTSSGTAASMIGQALKGQQQNSSLPAPTLRQNKGASIATSSFAASNFQSQTGSTPTMSSRPKSQPSFAAAKSQPLDAVADMDSDLPPSAFERRPTYASNVSASTQGGVNSSAPAPAAASLGGLSASFAMRGRELPAQLQDWAEKRRLRERYPQGDHSALPSAANSNATSAANSSATSEDESFPYEGKVHSERKPRTRDPSVNTEDEAEMAQRGRTRGYSNARETADMQAQQKLQDQKRIPVQSAGVITTAPASSEQERRGRQEAGRGRTGRSGLSAYNPPAALSSSVLAKKPALAFVDDGRNADENTPSVGDRLVSPQSTFEPSAQVTLRPRDPPPSSAAPLKPATRTLTGGSDTGSGKGVDANEAQSGTPTSTSKVDTGIRPRAPEKKVAFAETEDRVDHASVEYPLDEAEDREQKPEVRAPATAPKPERQLIDEAADAVFEIDEEGDIVDDEDRDEAPDHAECDRHKIEMSQSGLRTGESGRPRGQADDSLPGSEDEEKVEPDSRAGRSGSLSDDLQSASEDDEDKVPAGFGAASFSAMAASHTAMHSLDASMAVARADEFGFDPASLRFDGRVVSASAHASRDQDLESEPFVVGSLRNSARRTSIQLPSASIRSRGDESTRATDNAPTANNVSRQPRSSSRSRIAHMSKEDAETEVRLSGLLAPNAPSHRSLWSPKDAKTLKAAKNKYRLNEEDDEKWDAWKRKTATSPAGPRNITPIAAPQKTDDSGIRSVPVAVAPPIKYISAASGIGPRPLRESTMIDPDYANSIAAVTRFDKIIAAGVGLGLNIPRRTWGYGSFKDDTSGFETEPKTSLPYKEKMMVPSLRKAIRKSMFEATDQLKNKAKLETIPDAEDACASANAAATKVASQAQNKTPKTELPGSLVTRGFATSGANSGTATVESQTDSDLTSNAAITPTIVAQEFMGQSSRDLSIGTPHSGSRTGTPTSVGRRSPRPPYVPPPPPTSYSTILPEDPSQIPQILQLFAVPPDPCFQLSEDEQREEESETEEGWEKTLKFMHVVEQLKINKRTGWLHHRVSHPESIADHQYRMALLSILCPPGSGLDLGKCAQLALVHDLAEAEVGDLTPLDGVSKHEKSRREKEAIQYFVHDLLGSSTAGLRIEALWEEYEARETNEAKLVKDLDRFELCLQAIEYERRYGTNDLQPFFDGSAPYITHPTVRKWATVLARERSTLWNIAPVKPDST